MVEKGKNIEKPVKRTMIGGQALMEGVMMRGAKSMAMAVRAPDGSIMMETKRLEGRKWYSKVPIIRGVASFVSSMVTGVTTLLKSAEVSTPDEETPSKGFMALAVVLGVVFAVGLFILLPSLLNSLLLDKLFKVNAVFGERVGILLSSIFEGVLRILIFVGYLLLVSRMKDIRRTFMYHGAEHRTINCFEKGYDMTVENVQKCSTRHNRCGTTFLFFVMIISILVFSLCNWLMVAAGWGTNMFIKMGIRIVLLPLVAGLSYELLRGLAMMPDNHFTNALRAPGLALQRLTTYPPDDEMAEVAIKSFLAVYDMDADASIAEVKFGQYLYAPTKKYAVMTLLVAGLEEREAFAEADWMFCEIFKCKRGELNKHTFFNLGQYRELNNMLDRRKTGEPLDYILGKSEFFGLSIKVNNSVLIPRMDTEVLVNKAIELIGEGAPSVLDLCTGSGCIALALAKNTSATITASDISEAALNVARSNFEGQNINVIQSDMFEAIDGKFDYIISNPPYIVSEQIDTLATDVKAQPHMALDGGADGLDFYRKIAECASEHLTENGVILLEIGFEQAASVTALFAPSKTQVIKDLDTNDRVVVVFR